MNIQLDNQDIIQDTSKTQIKWSLSDDCTYKYRWIKYAQPIVSYNVHIHKKLTYIDINITMKTIYKNILTRLESIRVVNSYRMSDWERWTI